MSNFKLGYAWLQTLATAAANLTAATARPLTNLFSGSRSDRFELATASTDILTVNYDLGASTTKTANFLAIMRAKLLHRNDCTGVRLRGSTQSATLPSTLTPTAWFDANRGVTTVSGAVSQWNDLSGNNYHATQGAAGNRPLLSRSDNQENLLSQSQSFTTGPWASNEVLTPTSDSIVNPFNGGTGVIKTKVSTNLAYHYYYQSVNLIAGIAYRWSCYIKAAEYSRVRLTVGGTAYPGFPGALFYLNTQTVINANGGVGVMTSVGNGWYKCTVTASANTVSGSANFQIVMVDNSPTDYFTGDGTSGVYLSCASINRATSDSSYVQTSTYPMWAGINGNRALVFDGSNDYFANTLTVNPTGGMWGVCVVNPFTATANQAIWSAYGTTHRFEFYLTSSGGINCAVFNGATDFIGRTAPAATYVAGTTAIFSFTYDGGTSASGIKIYKNGTQVDTANTTSGAYTVPTAGQTINLGARAGAVIPFSGYLIESIFTQGATLSAGNHTALVEQLTTKYITTPIVNLNSLSTQTLMGPNDEDWFSVFTESSAFRHWWLELVNEGTASKYPCAKVFFGKALDLGREPQLPIGIDQTRQNPWSREAALSATLNFGPVSDTNKETLLNEVVKNADVMPVVALDPGQQVFNDSKGMHCKITDHSIEPYFGTDNDITYTLEEEI